MGSSGWKRSCEYQSIWGFCLFCCSCIKAAELASCAELLLCSVGNKGQSPWSLFQWTTLGFRGLSWRVPGCAHQGCDCLCGRELPVGHCQGPGPWRAWLLLLWSSEHTPEPLGAAPLQEGLQWAVLAGSPHCAARVSPPARALPFPLSLDAKAAVGLSTSGCCLLCASSQFSCLLSFSGFHSLELLDFWLLHAWRWLTAKVRIGSRCCVDAKQHNSISKFLNLSCSQWSSLNLLQIHWLGVDEFQKPILPCCEKSKASHVNCP